jgi:hypothetical protein
MHEANLHSTELDYCAIAIGFKDLKVRGKSVRRPAGPDAVFFRHQRTDSGGFEPPPRQTGFEACVEHRDGDQPLVIAHGRSIG